MKEKYPIRKSTQIYSSDAITQTKSKPFKKNSSNVLESDFEKRTASKICSMEAWAIPNLTASIVTIFYRGEHKTNVKVVSWSQLLRMSLKGATIVLDSILDILTFGPVEMTPASKSHI
jgi:hypothetical protein